MIEGAYISAEVMHLAPNKAFNQELLHGCHLHFEGHWVKKESEDFFCTCKAMKQSAYGSSTNKKGQHILYEYCNL